MFGVFHMSIDVVRKAQEVIQTEIEGLELLKSQIDGDFEKLVDTCIRVLDNGGKIVISGVGKSGHIGRKIAATLASTGSPAVYLHPVEALHGDLGVLQKNDILLALSYSGETDELLSILPSAKRLEVPTAAFTGVTGSALAQCCDITINTAVAKEACPFNLAPTTSSTALLAIGDALAMVLLEKRGFTKEDFGRLHPGGSIGRAVTLKISDVMRPLNEIATASPEDDVKEVLLKMTKFRCGSAIICDSEGKLAGIFTDGDFRRHVEDDMTVLRKHVKEVMTKNPSFLYKEMMAVEILKLLEKKKIDDVIVLDKTGKVAGLVDIQDLPGLKLM